MSNLDPTHAIPLLAAGALQSGMALVIAPTASGGFAVLLTVPEPMTNAEIEADSISAITAIDIMSTPQLTLARQICVTTRKLAEFLVSQCTPEECVLAHVEQSTFDLLKSERTAALAELPPTLTKTLDLSHLTLSEETGAND